MLTLLKYLKSNKLKTILYHHEQGELNIEYLNALSSISPDSWIIVITQDRSVYRYQDRKKFEVIYNDLDKYKPLFKYDVLFCNNKYATNKIFSIANRVVSPVPFEYYPANALEFYIPAEWILWLPVFLQTFLCRYKMFADKTLKLIMRSVK